jgi:hypothetical protein
MKHRPKGHSLLATCNSLVRLSFSEGGPLATRPTYFIFAPQITTYGIIKSTGKEGR